MWHQLPSWTCPRISTPHVSFSQPPCQFQPTTLSVSTNHPFKTRRNNLKSLGVVMFEEVSLSCSSEGTAGQSMTVIRKGGLFDGRTECGGCEKGETSWRDGKSQQQALLSTSFKQAKNSGRNWLFNTVINHYHSKGSHCRYHLTRHQRWHHGHPAGAVWVKRQHRCRMGRRAVPSADGGCALLSPLRLVGDGEKQPDTSHSQLAGTRHTQVIMSQQGKQADTSHYELTGKTVRHKSLWTNREK